MLGRAQMTITLAAVLLLGGGAHAGQVAAGPTPPATVGRGLSAHLPKDFEPAPRLDDVHQEIGWTAKDVERLATDAAAGANQQLLDDVARVSGRPADPGTLPDPVDASDLISYLIKDNHTGDYTIIIAEQGTAVGEDGAVYGPAEVAGPGETDTHNRLTQLPPEFNGPWFDPTYRTRFYQITRGHDASWWDDWPACIGRVEFQMGVWTHSVRLGDDSSRPEEDFFGIWRTLAAERTRGTGGVNCKDLLRSLESTFSLWEENMANFLTSSDWLAKDPLSFDSSGECTETDLSVTAAIPGGAGASISTTMEYCERWDTIGASEGNAYEYYGIKYDFGGICHSRARSGHYLIVARTNYQPGTDVRLIKPGYQWTHDLQPDQEPSNSFTCQ